MIYIEKIECLSENEKIELNALLERTGNPPTLESIWRVMDEVWDDLGCTYHNAELLAEYYRHPIWTLNGLFIEQHEESLRHRHAFAEYITALRPQRIADFGGGYGSLARIVAERGGEPIELIDIIEPYPSTLGQFFCKGYTNIRYKTQCEGQYDCIIATDVLEHVDDPLKMVEMLASHIKNGGVLILANCFYPVIKCHVSSTFHFRYSFNKIMWLLGLQKIDNVCYAHVYRKTGDVHIMPIIRFFESSSSGAFPLLERMRRGKNFLKRIVKELIRYDKNKQIILNFLRPSVLTIATNSLSPISRLFGFDRGMPLDRYYIEKFLKAHESDIQGVCLEIADASYSKKFGGDRVSRYEILHKDSSYPHVTLCVDLEEKGSCPESYTDIFICTQTLCFTYSIDNAIQNIHRILKPEGIVLCTVPAITQISRYDADRWGDYWRFTPQGIERLFRKYFTDVEVNCHGNVLVAKAFLDGLSVEDFSDTTVLDFVDEDYPVCITIRAKK